MTSNDQVNMTESPKIDTKLNEFIKNMEVNSINPSTKLLEKRRILHEVNEAFEKEKRNFNE